MKSESNREVCCKSLSSVELAAAILKRNTVKAGKNLPPAEQRVPVIQIRIER